MIRCPRCQRSYDESVRFCPVDGAPVVPTTDASTEHTVGLVLYGQFELRELAGRGATGTVWRAYQKSMDRIVAVKILHRELVSDSDVVRRFLREARSIARIIHPNIVTVHLVGETEEGTPYLVMEHVDGISLETIIEAQGPQSVGRVVHLGRQIAAGLAEAHANGIVHRDLKPANLLVTDRGRVADQVKIVDFGLAKLIRPGQEHSQVTRGQDIFGTPHYMAPEQATGEAIDARTDLYALGVTLFRMATGQVPFDAPAGMQVVLRHLRDEPPRPTALNPLVPDALEDLILACLQKNPADRPKDADDVIAALDAIGEASPTRERRAVPAESPPAAASPNVADIPPPPPQPTRKKTTSVPVAPVEGNLSGPMARPEIKRGDRTPVLIVLLLLVLGATGLWLSTRGAEPQAVVTADLATVPALDQALVIVDKPDRSPPDLKVAEAQPDMAKKKHHHKSEDDDDLPTTVFR